MYLLRAHVKRRVEGLIERQVTHQSQNQDSSPAYVKYFLVRFSNSPHNVAEKVFEKCRKNL